MPAVKSLFFYVHSLFYSNHADFNVFCIFLYCYAVAQSEGYEERKMAPPSPSTFLDGIAASFFLTLAYLQCGCPLFRYTH